MISRSVILWLLLLAVPAYARHKHLPEYRAFIPSHENLIAQNEEINRLGIPRIQNDRMLKELVIDGELLPLSNTTDLRVNVPARRAYLRKWAVVFLTSLSADYRRTFGKPLQVNSAVRPVSVQRLLRRWNRNAAPYSGDCASAHLAGIAFDLQRRGLTAAQKRWLQWRLLYYFARGDVIVEEELKQPCFHVVVRGSYPTPITTLPARIADEVEEVSAPGSPDSARYWPLSFYP